MCKETIARQVRSFIVENFLFGQDNEFKDSDFFLESGIIDSTGVLQLIAYLEETYGITVEDEEVVPENIDSINNVSAYLCRKLNGKAKSGIPRVGQTTPGGNV